MRDLRNQTKMNTVELRGGPEDGLWVTAGESVERIRLPVRGLPSSHHGKAGVETNEVYVYKRLNDTLFGYIGTEMK